MIDRAVDWLTTDQGIMVTGVLLIIAVWLHVIGHALEHAGRGGPPDASL